MPLRTIRLGTLLLVLLLAGACQATGLFGTGAAPTPPAAPTADLVPVASAATPLAAPGACSSAFVAHPLDHTTQAHGQAVRQFETNGSGVAVNDLNDDGWLDLVFANLNGPATIFWNGGQLAFRAETLPEDGTRAVNVVDVDGDGGLDIVFTHLAAGLSWWRNAGTDAGGQTTLTRTRLPNVLEPAHSLAWGDLNGDGTLDLVTGSYDAELNLQAGSAFLFSDGAGVYYYEQQAGTFGPQRLARQAQALAIALIDVTADGRPEILVGNDFDMQDQAWTPAAGGWQPVTPFAETTQHTMGFDWGDVDNDGRPELFATDMQPYDNSVATLAAWLPIMARSSRRLPRGDPQLPENVLQVPGADGRYRNQADERGLDATGWSWSGKFGDLDNDGWLDVYVVNGMINADLFAYLPGDELVEQNQALRNQGGGIFVPAPGWGLGATGSGRGMSLADLDNDGDLDIVVNNLRSPAQLFENQLCGGSGLEVELRWPGSANSRALGAQLRLVTRTGTYTRDVRAGSGYLSGDPARVHFGVPAAAELVQLEVRWPDGRLSAVDRLAAQTRVVVTR